MEDFVRKERGRPCCVDKIREDDIAGKDCQFELFDLAKRKEKRKRLILKQLFFFCLRWLKKSRPHSRRLRNLTTKRWSCGRWGFLPSILVMSLTYFICECVVWFFFFILSFLFLSLLVPLLLLCHGGGRLGLWFNYQVKALVLRFQLRCTIFSRSTKYEFSYVSGCDLFWLVGVLRPEYSAYNGGHE